VAGVEVVGVDCTAGLGSVDIAEIGGLAAMVVLVVVAASIVVRGEIVVHAASLLKIS
jgi:hypothetical protein